MIAVTRLDGSVMVVNDDQIAWIETRPDTVISMMNGEKLLVREALDTLVERAREFRRSLAARGALQMARRPVGIDIEGDEA
jgi:flagellar protein FlbD